MSSNITKVAVIGIGVIGAGWIIRALAHNKKVNAFDKDIKLEKELIKEIKRTWPYVKKLFNKKKLNLNKGSTSLAFRQKMSEEAISETAYYDALIADYFNKMSKNFFPKKKIFFSNLVEKLRYGENPHQESAIYSKTKKLDISQIHGKQLSYNNYNDIFSALIISKSLPKNIGTVIVKHANPCGVSEEKNKITSFKNALICDPVSAFGGVVAINSVISKKLALELNKIFFEVIISSGFKKDALKILKKRKNIRLIDCSKFNSTDNKHYL